MKLNIFIFSFIISIFVNAQTIQRHYVKSGTETIEYYYYEDNSNIIMHGKYSYSKIANAGKDKILINGNFINGFKNGIWNWEINYTNYYGSRHDKISNKVTKSYNKGLRNGIWSYKNTFNTYQNGNLIESDNRELVENFKNNIQVGELIFKENLKLPVKLNFNNNGLLIGNYTLPLGGDRIILNTNEFGVALIFFDNDKITDIAVDIGNKFASGKINLDEANENYIEVERKELKDWFYDINPYNHSEMDFPKGGEDLTNLTIGHFIHSKYNSYLEREVESKRNNIYSQNFIGTWELIEHNNKKLNKISVYNESHATKNIFRFTELKLYIDRIANKTKEVNDLVEKNKSETYSSKSFIPQPRLMETKSSEKSYSVSYDCKQNKVYFTNDEFNVNLNNDILKLDSENHTYILKKINL